MTQAGNGYPRGFLGRLFSGSHTYIMAKKAIICVLELEFDAHIPWMESNFGRSRN